MHPIPDTLGLGCQQSPKRWGVEVCQAQDSVGLARLPDPRHLILIVSQVQNNYHPLMACLGK